MAGFFVYDIPGQISRGTALVWGDATAKMGLSLDEIIVEGRSQASSIDIAEALQVEKGMPIFELDPHELRDRLEALPWVRSAIVERRLPHTLYVRLMERVPVALWQDGEQRTHLVDDRGVVIKEVTTGKSHSFFVVTGKDAPQAVPTLIKELDRYPLVKVLVTGASYVSSHQWELILNGRLHIKLPDKDLGRALAKLQEFGASGYFEKSDILSIDVRIPDRAFFYLTQNAAERRKGTLKKKDTKAS